MQNLEFATGKAIAAVFAVAVSALMMATAIVPASPAGVFA